MQERAATLRASVSVLWALMSTAEMSHCTMLSPSRARHEANRLRQLYGARTIFVATDSRARRFFYLFMQRQAAARKCGWVGWLGRLGLGIAMWLGGLARSVGPGDRNAANAILGCAREKTSSRS